MKQLAIFTGPNMAAEVELRHDSGFEASGVLGTADDRPAHLLAIEPSLDEGHGAQLTMTWASGKVLRQHGNLFLRMGDRARFAADIFEEPPDF